MQPNRANLLALLVLLMATATAAGCAKPWNVAHAGLEVTAEAVARTDAMVSLGMVDTHTKVRAEVVAQAREARQEYEACTSAEPPRDDCGARPTVEHYMGIYEERVQTWEAVTTALEVVREVLLLAETAVATWRDTKTQPENWGHICQRIGEAQASIVRAIEACDVDVPGQWEAALGALEPVCTFIAPAQPEPEEPAEEGDTP